jgi:DNA-binding CsgD family transcriptional regulator
VGDKMSGIRNAAALGSIAGQQIKVTAGNASKLGRGALARPGNHDQPRIDGVDSDLQTIDVSTTSWLFVLSAKDNAPQTASAFIDGKAIEISRHHQQRLHEILREIRETADRPDIPASPATLGCGSLTPRQLQIAGMVRDGFSNKIIARDLGLTAGTIKAHLHRIYRVMKIANRVELAIRAARHQDASSRHDAGADQSCLNDCRNDIISGPTK